MVYVPILILANVQTVGVCCSKLFVLISQVDLDATYQLVLEFNKAILLSAMVMERVLIQIHAAVLQDIQDRHASFQFVMEKHQTILPFAALMVHALALKRVHVTQDGEDLPASFQFALVSTQLLLLYVLPMAFAQHPMYALALQPTLA